MPNLELRSSGERLLGNDYCNDTMAADFGFTVYAESDRYGERQSDIWLQRILFYNASGQYSSGKESEKRTS